MSRPAQRQSRPSSLPPGSAADPGLHKRRINDLIDENVDGPRSVLTPFLCECPTPGCLRTVWLTADDYASSRVSPDWVVRAPGHGGLRGRAAVAASV